MLRFSSTASTGRSTTHGVARPSRSHRASLAAGLVILAVCTGAQAADEKKDREARRIQLLEQRFEEERAQLQTEKTDLQKKLADDEATIASLKSINEKAAADLEKLNKERSSVAASLAETERSSAQQKKQASEDIQAKDAELAKFSKAREQERVALNGRYEAQTKALQVCEDKNAKVIKIAHELLKDYRDKGVVEAIKQEEPVIGIGEVELFSQIQDYRDQVDAERVTPSSPTKSAESR